MMNSTANNYLRGAGAAGGFEKQVSGHQILFPDPSAGAPVSPKYYHNALPPSGIMNSGST